MGTRHVGSLVLHDAHGVRSIQPHLLLDYPRVSILVAFCELTVDRLDGNDPECLERLTSDFTLLSLSFDS